MYKFSAVGEVGLPSMELPPFVVPNTGVGSLPKEGTGGSGSVRDRDFVRVAVADVDWTRPKEEW